MEWADAAQLLVRCHRNLSGRNVLVDTFLLFMMSLIISLTASQTILLKELGWFCC